MVFCSCENFFGDVISTFFKFLVLLNHFLFIIFLEEVVEDETQHVMLIVMFFAFEGGINVVTIVDVV
jgi:hypothetical protein